MSDTFSFLPLVLLVLACPLMMVGMGVGAWLIARAKGEKKPLSMGCMMGQCEHPEHVATAETGLKEQVARLNQEVETLRAQVKASNGGDASAHELLATPSEKGLTSS